MKRKIVGCILTIVALVGLYMTMNEKLNYLNPIGLFFFGMGAWLGSYHLKGNLLNGQFIIDIKNFWRC
jgi:hypothetical protein